MDALQEGVYVGGCISGKSFVHLKNPTLKPVNRNTEQGFCEICMSVCMDYDRAYYTQFYTFRPYL